MIKREYNDSLYKKYKEGQNLVSKYKEQHSLRYDYNEIYKHLDKDNSFIVDVGCRDGGYVKHLQKLGYKNSYGIDIGVSGINKAKSDFGEDWVNKYLKLQDVQEKFPFDFSCDFVNLSHTLEHFVFPEKAMNNIVSHLKDDGFMWIVVPSDLPDCGGKLSTLEKGSDYHWIFFTDEKSIEDFLSTVGLTTLSIKHIYAKGKDNKKSKIGEWQVLCQKKKQV